MEWQPISDAPKDGSRVLVWAKGWDPCFLIWKTNPRTNITYFGDPWEMDDYDLPNNQPTHYFPLEIPK